jgi:hypothetical protein
MRLPSRVLLSCAAAISVLALLPLTAASGHDSGPGRGPGPAQAAPPAHGPAGDLLRSGLVGSTAPGEGGLTLFGVAPGGKTWVVRHGDVRVGRDGRLDVRIEGLVIPSLGGTNPVPAVSATLVCNEVPGTPTATAPLSAAGDGRIRAIVAVPTPCQAPAVLVNPNGAAGTYIAVNG